MFLLYCFLLFYCSNRIEVKVVWYLVVNSPRWERYFLITLGTYSDSLISTTHCSLFFRHGLLKQPSARVTVLNVFLSNTGLDNAGGEIPEPDKENLQRGVVALTFFPAGVFIPELGGHSALNANAVTNAPSRILVGPIGLVNHSCDPNAEVSCRGV